MLTLAIAASVGVIITWYAIGLVEHL